MNKLLFTALLATATGVASYGQVYGTRTAHINFFSTTKMEDIEADNRSVNCVLKANTGDLQFSALIKSFEFEKALMQEHFNENYMESSTYPKAEFKGKVEDMAALNLSVDGNYTARVTGALTMHGVTKNVTVDATFRVAGGKVAAESKFSVNPRDYNITIPAAVVEKISDNIAVTVKANLDKMQ